MFVKKGRVVMSSVVILGGNECMECRYREACRSCDLKRKIGSPDLIILFTSTASHQLAMHAQEEAKKCNAKIAFCHSASMAALQNVLAEHTA